MQKLIINASLFLSGLAIMISSCKSPEYKDPKASVEQRVEDLLSRMTLEEKLTLLGGDSSGFDTKGIDRLGVPALHLSDGPIGVRTGKSTAYPAAISLAASWDTVLLNNIGVAIAKEAKAKGKNYMLGPCINIHRLPVGGRNFESYGEDPYLTSRLAVAYVKGLQSEKVLASVKHFALNNQEWNRNDVDVLVSERAIREIYMPGFEAAVKEAHAWSIMTAYNIVNGQHCSENFHLVKDILKDDWGFKGFVVSDWVSVYSTPNAANAGLDLEMPEYRYFRKDSIMKYMKEGKITEDVINDKVRRQLRVRFEAGLFDEKPVVDTTVFEKHKALALQAAREGMVLLKNKNHILPIDKNKIKSIALIGPHVKTPVPSGGGSSQVTPSYVVTPFEGITKKLDPAVTINYEVGDKMLFDVIDPIMPDYFKTPDGKPGLKGEYYNNKNLSGEPVFTRIDKNIDFFFDLKSPDPRINDDNFSIRWTGKLIPKVSRNYRIDFKTDDGFRMWINNQLILDEWFDQGITVHSTHVDLKANVEYNIKIEYYEHEYKACAQLGWDIPSTTTHQGENQIEKACEAAKKSDIAVICIGSFPEIESEGRDRKSDMYLPARQIELIQAVSRVNPNTVVVLFGGIPVKVSDWLKNVSGLLDVFFPGQEGGNAIADILFGDYNPSGKMPFSFIKDTNQSPAFKGYKSGDLKARYDEGIYVGYRYLDKEKLEPAFPFGFGLSYTEYKYSNLKVEAAGNNQYNVYVDVENTGKTAGDEIVQLYVTEKGASVDRPLKELKAFSKVNLEAWAKKTVQMKLNDRSFAFYDVNTKGWKVEPGEFEVLVASSSRDIKLKETINLK